MVGKSIIWTKTAWRQRRAILLYWLDRNLSPSYPKKLIRLTREKLDRLSQNPNLAKDSDVPGIKIAYLGHFSIVFQVTEKELIVVAFWDNRQDPNELRGLMEKWNDPSFPKEFK